MNRSVEYSIRSRSLSPLLRMPNSSGAFAPRVGRSSTATSTPAIVRRRSGQRTCVIATWNSPLTRALRHGLTLSTRSGNATARPSYSVARRARSSATSASKEGSPSSVSSSGSGFTKHPIAASSRGLRVPAMTVTRGSRFP